MFYCFEAGQRLCSGACDGCGNACESCGRGCVDLCNLLGRGCESCCRPIAQVTSRPLGCFVIIAAILNCPAAALAYSTLTDPQARDCKDVSTFAYGALAIALINFIFSLYLQWRLDAAIRSGPQQGARAVLQQANGIVLYDFGFCIYVFFFVASIVFCFLGIGWWQNCRVKSWNAVWTAVLLLLFAFWTMIFACCWGGFVGKIQGKAQ
ncbi:unnamed protein product [Durusdinium trenchii]|uniref:Calcium-binding protein NCSA n=2 Tax=Durusdinium trenchii TaxID=1381693 RepID=A0ABP0M6V8_9DINO